MRGAFAKVKGTPAQDPAYRPTCLSDIYDRNHPYTALQRCLALEPHVVVEVVFPHLGHTQPGRLRPWTTGAGNS
jgi:hypothetical protein